MNRKEYLDMYYCDFCGIKIGIETPNKFLEGSTIGSKGVVYEPKVHGGYCPECLSIAQQNWDDYGQFGFVGDRYDTTNTEKVKKEIESMKEYKETEIDIIK